MANVRVTIMGNSHSISCADGQEERLISLAEKVNQKYEDLGLKATRVPEVLSFAIISMTLADELENAREELNKLKQNKPQENEDNYTINDGLITTLNTLTKQIYMIAENLKKG